MAVAVATLAACASLGGGKDAPLEMPRVSDPAPIVSGTMRPYQIRGRWYHPKAQPDYDETGMASWYGSYHHGRSTATGERFDMHGLTAAHKTLPLPSLVEVSNPANGHRVIVRVNDRGPFVDGRIIDLSRGAAEELGLLSKGVGEVRVRYAGPAPRSGGGTPLRTAAVSPLPPRPAPTSPTSGPVPYEIARAAEPAPAQRYLPGSGTVSSSAAIPTSSFAPSASSPVVTAPALSGYWVQVGAYANPRDARRFAQRLGERAQVQDIYSDGRPLYRVVVGPWPDANAAERARQAVAARGYRDALLISGG